MLNNLLYDQKKLCSTRLPRDDSVEAVLALIHQEKNLETGVLASSLGDQTLLLFVLQGRLYGSFTLHGNKVRPLLLLDYFRKIGQLEGELDLYQVSPVFFKSMLCLGQMQPKVVGTSNLLDIERLLIHVDEKKEEAVLLLKQEEEVNLFYFSEGVLCDGYLEETEEMREEPDLRDKLLVYAYASQEKPVSILLYEDINISPARDCETLEEEAAASLENEEPVSLNVPPDEVQPEGVSFSEVPVLLEALAEVPDLEKNNAPPSDEDEEDLPDVRENGVETLLEEAPVFDAISESISEESSIIETLLDQPPEISDAPPAGKSPDLWLEVLSGDRVGLLIRLASGRLSFGRGRVDVRFNDPQISRYHAELKRSQSGLIVTDQHSTNGVFVNGKKVTKEEVSLDDVIRIGDTSLKVIYAK